MESSALSPRNTLDTFLRSADATVTKHRVSQQQQRGAALSPSPQLQQVQEGQEQQRRRRDSAVPTSPERSTKPQAPPHPLEQEASNATEDSEPLRQAGTVELPARKEHVVEGTAPAEAAPASGEVPVGLQCAGSQRPRSSALEIARRLRRAPAAAGSKSAVPAIPRLPGSPSTDDTILGTSATGKNGTSGDVGLSTPQVAASSRAGSQAALSGPSIEEGLGDPADEGKRFLQQLDAPPSQQAQEQSSSRAGYERSPAVEGTPATGKPLRGVPAMSYLPFAGMPG